MIIIRRSLIRSKVLPSFLLLFLFYGTPRAQKKFEIDGRFLLDGATVSLLSNDAAFGPVAATVKNRQFKITGKINQDYEYVTVKIEKAGKFIAAKSFFIKPCKMSIRIVKKTDSDEYSFAYTNVPFVKAQHRYDSVLTDLTKSLDEVFSELSKDKALKLGKEDSILSRLKKVNDDIISARIGFIRSNKSYYGLYLLEKDILNKVKAQIRVRPDTLYELFSTFSSKLQQTRIGLSIKSELQKQIGLLIGKQMPVFSFSDTGSNKYILKSLFSKKYVLVGFWFTGCVACKKSFPIIQEMERQYNENLEVVMVSIDKEESIWKKSMQKYNVPGINTLNTRQYTPDDISSLFNIEYAPQYFLIDRSGKLVYHNVQSGDDDYYAVLKQVLKQFLDEAK